MCLCDQLVKTAGHWPSPVPKRKNGGKAPCQICWWADGRNFQSRTDVAVCEFCGVCLCIDGCFKTFHKVFAANVRAFVVKSRNRRPNCVVILWDGFKHEILFFRIHYFTH